MSTELTQEAQLLKMVLEEIKTALRGDDIQNNHALEIADVHGAGYLTGSLHKEFDVAMDPGTSADEREGALLAVAGLAILTIIFDRILDGEEDVGGGGGERLVQGSVAPEEAIQALVMH